MEMKYKILDSKINKLTLSQNRHHDNGIQFYPRVANNTNIAYKKKTCPLMVRVEVAAVYYENDRKLEHIVAKCCFLRSQLLDLYWTGNRLEIGRISFMVTKLITICIRPR